MAARVSSSSRPSHLHHNPSSNPSATNHSSVLHNSSIALPPSPSSSSSTPSSSPGSVFDPEPSPSTLSLAASDASSHDYSRQLSASTVNNGSQFITPATSPIPPQSPLEPVAKSIPSATPASLSRNRLHQPQPQIQPPHQQLGANSARGDLKTQRAGGFLAFAASALDRTQSAISPTGIRHKRSLSRLSISGDTATLLHGAEPSPDKTSRFRPVSVVPSSPSASIVSAQSAPYKAHSSQSTRAQEPIFSQPYTDTDPSQPPPVLLPRVDNKMHQTSSRLLRMTDDDRPFTKVSHPSILIRFSLRPERFPPFNFHPVAKQHSAWECGAVPAHLDVPSQARSEVANCTCRTSRISLRR